MKHIKVVKRALKRGYVLSGTTLSQPIPARIGDSDTRGVLPLGYKLSQPVHVQPCAHHLIKRSA